MRINSGATPHCGHRARIKRPCGIDVLGVVVLLVVLTFGAPAHAACPASPVGSNQDRVIQMVAGGDGMVQMGSDANVNATEEGAIVYDATKKTLVVCDGTNWVTLGGGAPCAGGKKHMEIWAVSSNSSCSIIGGEAMTPFITSFYQCIDGVASLITTLTNCPKD